MLAEPLADRNSVGSHEASTPPSPLSPAFSPLPSSRPCVDSEAQSPRENEAVFAPRSPIHSRKEGVQRQVFRPETTHSHRSRNLSGATAGGFLRPMNSQVLQAQRNTLRSSTSSSPGSPSQLTSPVHQYDDRTSQIEGSIESSERSADRFFQSSPWRMNPLTSSHTTTQNEGSETLGRQYSSSLAPSSSEAKYDSKIPIRENARQPQEQQEQEQGHDDGYEHEHDHEQQNTASSRRSVRNTNADISYSTATPASLREKGQSTTASRQERQLGRNFEYFTGNVYFFCGGRFLNSRNWPVNVLTGALQCLPAILFFVYSYVHFHTL